MDQSQLLSQVHHQGDASEMETVRVTSPARWDAGTATCSLNKCATIPTLVSLVTGSSTWVNKIEEIWEKRKINAFFYLKAKETQGEIVSNCGLLPRLAAMGRTGSGLKKEAGNLSWFPMLEEGPQTHRSSSAFPMPQVRCWIRQELLRYELVSTWDTIMDGALTHRAITPALNRRVQFRKM